MVGKGAERDEALADEAVMVPALVPWQAVRKLAYDRFLWTEGWFNWDLSISYLKDLHIAKKYLKYIFSSRSKKLNATNFSVMRSTV